MEHGEHDLESGTVLLLVHARRDASAVILYAYGIVFKYTDVYRIAEAAHSLVYTVVYYLVHKMMESPFGHVPDIHRRTLADCLESFQHLYAVGGILLFRLFHLFLIYHFTNNTSLQIYAETERNGNKLV